ncbi:MAG: AMP-binding protein [Microvirga sp.]
MPIRTVADIESLEAQPLAERALPQSTYEALAATASRTPDASALSFFLTADTYKRAFTWTYRELLADVTRAANAFHAFGVDAEHPVALVLPNLPETHFTIWGAKRPASCSPSTPCLNLATLRSSCALHVCAHW